MTTPELPLTARPDSPRHALDALRQDLIHEDGPRISTMRNYRFALVQYDPATEFELRQEVQRLSSDLVAAGWTVLPISLQRLLHDRIRAQGPDFTARLIQMEKRLSPTSNARALKHLEDRLAPLIEGPDGLAADCARIISDYIDRHPDKTDRTLAIIGRAGALYPFFRSSALLRHLDGKTQNVPVVLLYPGTRHGPTSLSFMGELPADSDYRPRIYS